MVDRICKLSPGKYITGIKNISWNDDFLEEVFPGGPFYSPVIAAEAVAQLISWLIIKSSNFSLKPVITMLDSFDITGYMIPGDQLQLTGQIESISEDSALAHGKVLVNGRSVIELNHAVCYLYPLGELDHPQKARIQFKNLYDGGKYLLTSIHNNPLPIMREKIPITTKKWVDTITEDDQPDRLRGLKNVTATEAYFNDHFPRKPVLPGVLIVASMVSLSRTLVNRLLDRHDYPEKKPVAVLLKKIKFRKFIQPGDQLYIDAEVLSFAADKSSVKAKVICNNKTAAAAFAEFIHLDYNKYRKNYPVRTT